MSRFYYSIFLLLCALMSHRISAQVGLCNQVLASTGNTSILGDRSYTYTVGEAFIFTLSADSRQLTQGFNQPDLCNLVSSHDVELDTWQLELYPNPAVNQISIRYSNDKKGQLKVRVFDVLGHLILDNLVLDHPDVNVIDCSAWQPGIYLIHIIDPSTHTHATVRVVHL